MPYTCKGIPRRLLFVLSILGYCVCCILLGPSKFLGLPYNKWIMLSSFPLQGLFQVYVFLPIIPEMIERVQVKYDIVEGEDEFLDAQLNDSCNDAYGFIYALSMFFGPLVGSWVKSATDGRTSCDIFALVNLFLAVVLIIFNCGPFVFSENRAF
jgi:hypothetical protein